MNLPSLKTLSRITDDRTQARKLRTLLETYRLRDTAKLTALIGEHYPKTTAWVHSCYNMPRNIELTLYAADELLGTFGVERIDDPDNDVMGDYELSYLNTGDSYADTLCYNAGRFFVGSWGDFVERKGL